MLRPSPVSDVTARIVKRAAGCSLPVRTLSDGSQSSPTLTISILCFEAEGLAFSDFNHTPVCTTTATPRGQNEPAESFAGLAGSNGVAGEPQRTYRAVPDRVKLTLRAMIR
jgi:hypothetical protein